MKSDAAFRRFLLRPRLHLWLAGLALLLASPSLFIGFHLDDFIGRYIFSDLEGADRLYRLYASGYGLANGVPADNHWQIEAGHAPWWMYDHLLMRMWRPLSLLTHLLDASLWIDVPFLQHAHSLAWLALLVVGATRMYRGMLGPLVGGLAALLLAIDHTHGFVVGFICNRHTLVTATIGVFCIAEHHRSRELGKKSAAVLSILLYGGSLLSSEAAVAIAGYLFGYALFVERGSFLRRALTFAPYFVVTLVWRGYYTLAGYGARGSGLYLDPAGEPARFFSAFLERAPILTLGQFFLPPAEAYPLFGPVGARIMFAGAILACFALVFALAPLLRRDRFARFWALGFAFALVPASTTHPHGRQLLLASFGAMALIAQLWHLHSVELKDGPTSPRAVAGRLVSAIVLLVHLLLSPLWSPVATSSIVLLTPVKRAAEALGPEIGGKDVVFVTAPDYFATRIAQLRKRIEGAPLPRRWRALAFGTEQVTLERPDSTTLVLAYEGGILSGPLLELFRDRRIPMTPGERIELEGLSIEILSVTKDRRAERVRFRFDTPLEDPMFRFYYWANNTFTPYTPPLAGGRQVLPAAKLELGL